MIKTYACHAAACDVCHETPESDYGYSVDHFDDPDAALEKAREDEWWATESAVLCVAGGVEHAAKAADIAADLAGTDSGGEGIADFADWCERSGYEIDNPGHTEPVAAGPVADV